MNDNCRYNILVDYKNGTSKISHEDFPICLGYYVDKNLNEFVIIYDKNLSISINRDCILKVSISTLHKREVKK